jgi:ACS family hexuronate transporter-like MFS transporter
MRIPYLRWWIAGLLFMASVLNYVDRNAFSLLAPTIQKDLHLTDQDYANIQVAFQVAYAIGLLLSGLVVDRLGSRKALALFVGWWSLASLSTSMAASTASLGVVMFLLGLGEAGNWTAAPKAVSEWFPARQRGLAIGLYTAGTPIGMTLAPIVLIWLMGMAGWRATFVAMGLLGFVWIVPWLIMNRTVKTHPWLTQKERDWINIDTHPEAAGKPQEAGWTYGQALRRPEVWCLCLGRMLSDPVWFFYLIWYPKYLVSARGLTQVDVNITWVVFLAAGVGSMVGGWLASVFIKRGWTPPRARLAVMFGCALCMPFSPLVAFSPTLAWSLTFAAVICFAHLAWLTNITSLIVDVVPGPSLGKVFGIVSAGSCVGAIVMNKLVARLLEPDPITKLVQTGAYNKWYIIAAGLHLAVIPVLAWGVIRKQPQLNNTDSR